MSDETQEPWELEIDNEVDSVRFYLMIKIHCGLEKRYEMYTKDLQAKLRKLYQGDAVYADKVFTRIMNRVAATLPDSFLDNTLRVKHLSIDGKST
jgi:hypothetical protein